RSKASEHRETFQIGRSHGVHAEPITFGLKLAMWSEEMGRNVVRWERAVESIATGKISGAVGTYQHLDPEVETEACKRLGINAATVSSQVVQRDHHAEYLTALAIIGASMEKIAIEIRHLQRTEVLEAEEFFSKGQKGSSAMPHKRNPIITERMTGFARLLRANAHTALENIALWHERDISHSSVERIIIPDSTNIMDYMLNKMIALMENLLVYPENMLKNLNKTGGLIFSQEVLLALIKKGITREESYALVQRNAMQVWEEQKDFKTLLKADSEIMNLLSEDEIDDLFDLQKVMKNINKVFERLNIK
ncbi:adenylosuccinate lyase, partial [Verrucomicrobia bacterium]|nr:adenylosuccinate lyase [Verrucomicrobiota bacterium]